VYFVTVIIGIRCLEGIVVAADGAATFGMTGKVTARQPVRKLTIIEDCVIFGHSGQVGMAQRLEPIVRDVWSKGIAKKKTASETMHHLRNRFWESVIKDETEVAQIAKGVTPQAQQYVMQNIVLALPPLKGEEEPCLFQFDWQGSPEMTTENLPCFAVGSGQPIADPFLSFLREVFWNNLAPKSLADSIFAANWTLHHVIKTSPAFVGEPSQIMVLKQTGTEQEGWIAKELTEDELQEHNENIAAAENHLRKYADIFRPTP
jgi:20S proteasome alpha/beta subunit